MKQSADSFTTVLSLRILEDENAKRTEPAQETAQTFNASELLTQLVSAAQLSSICD